MFSAASKRKALLSNQATRCHGVLRRMAHYGFAGSLVLFFDSRAVLGHAVNQFQLWNGRMRRPYRGYNDTPGAYKTIRSSHRP